MIEKIVVDLNVPVEKVFQFLVDYDKHYTEVNQDHLERVVDIKDPDLEHPDVSFYFRQISPITGREQKIRGKVTVWKLTGTLAPGSCFQCRLC